MRKRLYRILYIASATLWLAVVSMSAGHTLTDSAGRAATVPDKVDRVFATAPPQTLLVYAIAPESLIALTNPVASSFYAADTRLLQPRYVALPTVGGWHGGSKGANMEALLALNPQVIIAWNNSFAMEPVLQTFEKFKIPTVFVNENKVADEPASIRLVGQALGREKAAEALARDAEARLAAVRKLVDSIPPEKRPTIYYAQGSDGLLTQLEGSYHYDPFLFVGGKSLFPGEQTTMMGTERVSLEEIIRKNPDVIIATDPMFAMSVSDDSRWAGINAVKNKRVYLVPCDPVNFLDRPPSLMRILGVQWLASVLYPQDYTIDMVKETIDFYKLYLHVDLDEKQARAVLKP